nr:hypothetical protein [uncultured Desulfobacter sp.]
MLPVSDVVILSMGISLWFNVKNQKGLGMDQLDAQNKSLAQAVEGGSRCSLPWCRFNRGSPRLKRQAF